MIEYNENKYLINDTFVKLYSDNQIYLKANGNDGFIFYDEYTIIGKPITLTDVLRWMLDILKFSITDSEIQKVILFWLASEHNLLENQSIELVDFLNNL